MKESEYLSEVYHICDFYGAKAHHCNDPKRCHGRGLPDLIIVGKGGVLWREVKTWGDKASPEQTEYLWLLRAIGQDAEVWDELDLQRGIVAAQIARVA